MEHYRRSRWALLPRLVGPAAVSAWATDVLTAPSRRVTVGDRIEWWAEHAIAPGSSLGEFLRGPVVCHLASAAAGVALDRRVTIWAQVYHLGEKIPWHRDTAGHIQFLLCLEAPDEECGGAFSMRAAGSDVRIQLRAGDALVFEATGIPHSTTRLAAAHHEPEPRRITAVARFFRGRDSARSSHLRR